MTQRLSRRNSLGKSAVIGTALSTGYHSSRLAAESTSSFEKLNIATISGTGRAAANINGVDGENLVAIADIGQNLLDQAIKTGGLTTCNFNYSGVLTESVLLGVASYRSGKSIDWNAENLKATNSPHAQQYIHKEYRKGWTL